MLEESAKRAPVGRTALGGAAGGFTYDGAMQDAVARDGLLRRQLRLSPWQTATRPLPPTGEGREPAEREKSDLSA